MIFRNLFSEIGHILFCFLPHQIKGKGESSSTYTHTNIHTMCETVNSIQLTLSQFWFWRGPTHYKSSRPSNLNLPHDKSWAWLSLHRIYVHWHIEPDQRVINLPHTRWRENPTLFLAEWYSSPWPIMGEPEIQQLDTFSSEHWCISFAQQTNWISLHLCTQKLVT